MSDFLFDKAHMALKAQRFEEAQSTYELALQEKYTVKAWVGLGVCKLFQLTEDQTIEEVLFCYDKAKSVDGANKTEIEKHLLEHSILVVYKFADYAISAIKSIKEAEKKAKKAAFISLASFAIGGMSDSNTSKIISSTIGASAVGVAVGQFAKMKSSKETGIYATEMINNLYENVYKYLVEKSSNLATQFKNITDELCHKIMIEIDPNIEKINSNTNTQPELSTNAALKEIVSIENKETPFEVFENELFMKSKVDTDGILHRTHKLTLSNANEINAKKFNKIMSDALTEEYKTESSRFEFFRINKLKLRYTYIDRDNKVITTCEIPFKKSWF